VLDPSTKAELENLIKSIVEVFTKNYIKQYALGLVKKAEEEAQKDPGPDWKLLTRPENDNTDPLKTGYLVKKGAVVKNWKKRWIVVRPDYVVEYFENEKSSQGAKPKPKGKMFLAGYRVVDDPNAGVLQQLTKLAEQMKIDISELPKAKQYEPEVFEVHHPRRRCYFIKASSMAEKEEWMGMFRTVCWYAWGLEDKDPVHQRAYYAAIRETRWHLGRWGWWSYGGSETQLLSDLINDEIEWQTLGKILAKIPAVPWAVRSKMRDTALKFIDGVVSAAVTPAWTAMKKAVDELRPKIEPTLSQLVEPLGKQKEQLLEKMKDACMSVIKPALEEHVVPKLSKIMEVIKSPVVDGYSELKTILNEQFNTFDHSNIEGSVKKIDQWSRWSWWEARKATDHFSLMYDPLWALNIFFPDIYPWSTIWNGQDQLRKILDNAVYTYGHHVKSKTHESPTATLTAVVADYDADAKTATTEYYLKIFKDIIMPFFNKIVLPLVKTILDPLNDVIPDAMKQLIDPYELFDKFENKVIDESLKVIIEG